MLKNYIKIAFRNLTGNKGFTFLNISGLVIGMAGTILILLWIQHELSVDRFHEKGKRILQVWNRAQFDGEILCWNSTPNAIGPALIANYPEIETAVRYKTFGDILTNVGERNFSERVALAGNNYFDFFSFYFLYGNKSSALENPNSVVITEDLALKLFDRTDVLGETIRLKNTLELTVTGVIADLPNNTQFEFSAMIPWKLLKQFVDINDDWDNNYLSTFILVNPKANIDDLNRKVRTITQENSDVETEVFLHPFEDLYLKSEFKNGVVTGGRIDTVKMFGVIAVLILLIACINFMNLSTARSEKRAKEVGIRKLSGAKREWLVIQFMIESIILATFAGILAISLVQIALPMFNTIIDTQLTLPFNNLNFWMLGLILIIFTGLLAGSYPAFFLSSFLPARVLKASPIKANSIFALRKSLVVIQFTFAVILIASTFIVQKQIQFAANREKGYNQDQLIYHSYDERIEKSYESFRAELLDKQLVASITKTMSPITSIWSNSSNIGWEGRDPSTKVIIDRFSTDSDLIKTMGFELVAGRDIDIRMYPSDSNAAIINESAQKLMGYDDPIGKTIIEGEYIFNVVGVIKDYINISPYLEVNPLVIYGPDLWFSAFHFKLKNKEETSEQLIAVDKIFKKYYPEVPFDYHFVDETYAKKFSNQERISKLTTLFSGLAIVISCLGLFGLSAYAAEKRVKEMGVRKTLGASASSIIWLLSTDFIKLVLISIVVAVPITWYFMTNWLEDFEYKISLSYDVFLTTSVLCLLIAVITVVYNGVKAAYMDPVKSLRYE